MLPKQYSQKQLSQAKTEKTLVQNTTSKKELKEQIYIYEPVIEYDQESKKEDNVNFNQFQNYSDKQKPKTILTKDLKQKYKTKNNQELNHQHQIYSAEEDLQFAQETSQKVAQKKTFIVNKEKMAFQNQIMQKIQEMESQLKFQQQEIGILKQNQSKEILPKSNQGILLNEELQKDNFQLTQFIQIQINEFNRNYQQKIENKINEILSSFRLEQKYIQQNFEQFKSQFKFDSENTDKIIKELTSKLNQINQIQETFQKDLIKLQQTQGGKSRQPQTKDDQIRLSQITQEQLNQFNFMLDEKVRDIIIYVDDHLKNLQKKIVQQHLFYFQRDEKSEIYKIKDELLQASKNNFDKVLDLINTKDLGKEQQLLQQETRLQKEQQIQKQQFQENVCQDKYLQNNFIEINDNFNEDQIDFIEIKDDFNEDQINQIESKKNIKFLSINDTINIEFDQLRSQSIKKYINQLYDVSSRKRDTEKQFQYYLRKIQSEKELYEYYFIHNPQIQMELRKHCSQFRQVRGDGNCFYSAFGFQYMELLIRFSDDEFNNFKNLILDKFSSKITYQNFNTDKIPNFSDYLIFEFIYRIQQIRKISDFTERQNLLEKQFAAHSQESDEIDGCFYGVVIIFFRNLSNYLYENSDMFLIVTENNNILIWEQEFNSTELIISELAKFLKIHIVLLFFEKNGFKLQEYQSNNQDKIILLIRPGHYNIGIQ